MNESRTVVTEPIVGTFLGLIFPIPRPFPAVEPTIGFFPGKLVAPAVVLREVRIERVPLPAVAALNIVGRVVDNVRECAEIPFSENMGVAVYGKYDGRAVGALAGWMLQPGELAKTAIGIYNVQYDYYNSSMIYRYTKQAIDMLNPSPKN